MGFDLNFIYESILPALNRGLFYSVALIVPAAVIGFIFGLFLGVIRVFGHSKLKAIANFFVAVIRGVPLIVQLMVIYFGLPHIGIYFNAYGAALFSFILCTGAYQSEYIRGALLSIKQGQLKAAYALGFTKLHTILYIIVPQAARRALPGCGNEIIYLIKYSSLAYLVTCMEIMGEASSLVSMTFRPTEVYLFAGLYYLGLVSIATFILNKLEKHFDIPGFGRIN